MRRILIAAAVALFTLAAFAPVSAPAFAQDAAAPSAAPAPFVVASQAFPQAMSERSIGDEKAPVVLDEYFALTCPHCAHFHKEILPQLQKEYIDTGKLRLVFHDFIFNEVGLKAAMVSRCVAPTSYKGMITTLFETQSVWTNPQGGEESLKQVAGFGGLAPAQYTACVGDKSLSDWLLQGRVDAINNLNVEQTPTFLIRGSLERIVGAQDFEQFKVVIDRLLAKAAPAAP